MNNIRVLIAEHESTVQIVVDELNEIARCNGQNIEVIVADDLSEAFRQLHGHVNILVVDLDGNKRILAPAAVLMGMPVVMTTTRKTCGCDNKRVRLIEKPEFDLRKFHSAISDFIGILDEDERWERSVNKLTEQLYGQNVPMN